MSGEALSDELVNDFHLIMALFGHYQNIDAKYKMIMVITLLWTCYGLVSIGSQD